MFDLQGSPNASATASPGFAREPDGFRSELGFLIGALRPGVRHLAFLLPMMLVESAVLLAMPWFAAKATQSLLDGVVPDRLLLTWLAILTLQLSLGVAHSRLLGIASATVIHHLGCSVYDHLQSLPLRWHQARPRGDVLALLTHDVWQINRFVMGVLTPLFPLLFTCVGAVFLLLRIELVVGLVVAMGVPVFVVVTKLFTRELRPLARAQMREEAAKFAIAEQNLAAIPLIKAFTQEPKESARFFAQGEVVRGIEIRQLMIESILGPAVRWLGAVGVLGLLWLGGGRLAGGAISAPDLVSLLLYGLLLTQPVSQLASLWGRMQMARGSAHRLLAAFSEQPEPDEGKRKISIVKGDIAFERVAFAYANRPPVYDNLNWAIHPGETVAITGANGTGKSTLAHLLLRFADPSAGRITLDGVDIRELRLANLRGHIGLVSQHVLLLNATVAENIGYGRLGATREEIERAARAAHAHDFIEKLPQGYDTVIGDEGLRLSGGQRQRVSLARALLKDPAILILDEATAMFDPEGERGFIAECHALLKERTVLLITHRPASLALADRVFRLENGQMREVETAAAP